MPSIKEVLAAHEIAKLSLNPIPGNPRTNGFWIAIAYCKCGNTSPPENRADHLARELEKANV